MTEDLLRAALESLSEDTPANRLARMSILASIDGNAEMEAVAAEVLV